MTDGTESKPPVPARSDYGSGCYRRTILLEADGDTVRGELADDFHHFAVTLTHDGNRAITVEGADVRVPWTTCPGAIAPLKRMQGVNLSSTLSELLRYTDARAQCTHLHDLSCLAAVHAARNSSRAARVETDRRYDIAIPDRVQGEVTCDLSRDSQPLLSWQIRGATIIGSNPGTYVGLRLSGREFHRFCAGELDRETAEAAWVMQRAIFIGLGRQYDFESIHEASTFAPVVGAACHTFDPRRIADAKRVYGSVRDFTDSTCAIEHLRPRDPR